MQPTTCDQLDLLQLPVTFCRCRLHLLAHNKSGTGTLLLCEGEDELTPFEPQIPSADGKEQARSAAHTHQQHNSFSGL